jgi:chromosome segregation ATPase
MMSKAVNEVGHAGAVKGRTLGEVEADVARAVEELQKLKAERSALHESIKAATKEQDAVRLKELAGPSLSLRMQLSGAQARLWLLYAERARLQLPEAEAQAEAARAAFEEAYAEYLETHARVNRLGVESDNARVRAQGLRHSAEENEQRARGLSRRLPAGQA